MGCGSSVPSRPASAKPDGAAAPPADTTPAPAATPQVVSMPPAPSAEWGQLQFQLQLDDVLKGAVVPKFYLVR